MNSNEEIILSSLCDRIMAFCNRLNKRLDEYGEFPSSLHEQPLPQPPYGLPPLVDAGFHPPHAQPPDPLDWQRPYRPYDCGAHYFHNQPTPSHNYHQPPLPYLQQRPQSYRQPPLTAAAAASLPHQNYQPVGQQPCTEWWPTDHHHHAVYCCEQPTDLHQHHTHGQDHHQYPQLVQPGEAYWQQHHQYQEPVLNQQPPPQHFPSYWHPPSRHSEKTPSAAISPCSPDIRYDSNELFAVDIEESVRCSEIHYVDTAIEQLLNRDQIEEEDVRLDVEEEIGFLQGFEVANFEYVDEAERVVEEEPAPPSEGKATTELDCVSFMEDRLQDQYEVQKVERFNAMGKGKRSPKQMVSRESCPKQENLLCVVGQDLIIWEHAIISHRPTSLDDDARLIPPRDNTPSPNLLWELSNVGEELDRILSWGGKYEEEDATVVIVQILNIVTYCHLPVVVHRDLRPEKFLFVSNEEHYSLKAIDFGLPDYVMPDERLNDIVVSVYYVAPEFLNRSHGTEAEMWSIGVIAYILLYGSRAFWARTGSEIFRAVLIADLSFEEDPWSNLSPDVMDFVHQLFNEAYGEVFASREFIVDAWTHEVNVVSHLEDNFSTSFEPLHAQQFDVDVFDPASDYVILRKFRLDFQTFKKLSSSPKLTFCYDALLGVAKVYAKHTFVEELGAKERSLLNCAPKEDFGGGNPDPNLAYAREPVARMGLHKSDNNPDPPELVVTADGNVDRNMDFAKRDFELSSNLKNRNIYFHGYKVNTLYKDGVAGGRSADIQEKVIGGGRIMVTEKIRTISCLVYTLLKWMCRPVPISSTNVAILGVFRRLMCCLSEKLEHETYGLGVVVLFGNAQSVKINEHQELHDVFLDSCIFELDCLVASWFPP